MYAGKGYYGKKILVGESNRIPKPGNISSILKVFSEIISVSFLKIVVIMNFTLKSTMIELRQGDITEFEADALVNAANNHLWMGGGVAGAIKRKGGQIIEDEAVKLAPIPIGEAVVTTAGILKAKHVIHAAGMGLDLRTDEVKIRNAMINSLKRAEELGIKSIAFPSIGTGVGGFPLEGAADIMIKAALDHINQGCSLGNITFVLYDKNAYDVFKNTLEKFIKE